MPQPPNNNQPVKPPAEPLTPQEWEELQRERREAEKLFQRLIEEGRQPAKPAGDGTIIPPPTPTTPDDARKNRGSNFSR
jgi:hypothetical protein